MKDGIYYTPANGGTTYFVLNDKVFVRGYQLKFIKL